jgi:hypothetical protein
MRILVCDDYAQEADKSAGAARAGWAAAGLPAADLEIESLASKELGEELTVLFRNVGVAMGEAGATAQTRFDGRDLVLIDNNLAHLELGGARHTAETVAGFIRAFSSAGFVVSLNRNPGVDFDLKHLIGDATSIADQALNVDHLSLAPLWKKGAQGDFRPWYWPELSTAPSRRTQQIAEIRDVLDTDVLTHFGFDEATVAALSRAALGAFSGGTSIGDAAKGAAPLTFRQFFRQSARSVPAESDRALVEGNNEVVARVAAAELEMWLRRHVLGPQEALVDLPHLLARMGYLLGAGALDLGAWNAAILNATEPYGVDQPLFDDHLKARRWLHPSWLGETVFQWPALNADEDLGARFFSSAEWGDFVFCEDTSKFALRNPDGAAGPQEFAAELDGQWNRRFVAKLPTRKYAPLSRLAM